MHKEHSQVAIWTDVTFWTDTHVIWFNIMPGKVIKWDMCGPLALTDTHSHLVTEGTNHTLILKQLHI